MCTDIDRIDKYPMWQSRQRLELLICLSSDATFQLTPAEQNSPWTMSKHNRISRMCFTGWTVVCVFISCCATLDIDFVFFATPCQNRQFFLLLAALQLSSCVNFFWLCKKNSVDCEIFFKSLRDSRRIAFLLEWSGDVDVWFDGEREMAHISSRPTIYAIKIGEWSLVGSSLFFYCFLIGFIHKLRQFRRTLLWDCKMVLLRYFW